MNNQIEMPVVTPDDVLHGSKTFPVSKRKGGTVDVTVKAVDWRTSLSASAMTANGSVDGAMEKLFARCLEGEQKKDEFLNEIVPDHLFWIATVAMNLTNGVDAAKKIVATGSGPDSPTSSPPSPN